MLFLIVTTPRRDSPSTVNARRQEYWKWIDPLLKSGEVRWVYARVGRGGVALFDVDSTLKLHQYINEWAEYIPAHFDVYPLLDSTDAQKYLKAHAQKYPQARTGSHAVKKAHRTPKKIAARR